VRRIPVRILSRRLLVLSFSLPFSIDSDVTDQSLFPWRKRETKGREEKRAEREREREREREEGKRERGRPHFFFHLFRFLEQAGSHRTPQGPGNVSIRGSRARRSARKREREREEEKTRLVR